MFRQLDSFELHNGRSYISFVALRAVKTESVDRTPCSDPPLESTYSSSTPSIIHLVAFPPTVFDGRARSVLTNCSGIVPRFLFCTARSSEELDSQPTFLDIVFPSTFLSDLPGFSTALFAGGPRVRNARARINARGERENITR